VKHCPNDACAHLERHGFVNEFLDAIERCSDCDSPLAWGPAPTPGPLEFQPLVTVYRASDGVTAHLVRALLESRGIEVAITGEPLQGAVGELPAAFLGIRLRVPPDQADRARALAVGWDSRPRKRASLVELPVRPAGQR